MEMTGRTVIVALGSFFGVKKVDEQAYEQENEEKSQIEKLYPLCTHIILYLVGINIIRKDKNVNLAG